MLVFPPGHFGLELEGQSAGYAKSIEGGGAVADVVKEKIGADHMAHKHIGAVRYDDIIVTCGAGLSKAFYDWVSKASTNQYQRKDGAVVVYRDNKEVSRLTWLQGQITEIDFPALDAASKDSFSMTVKIAPERTRIDNGGTGKAVPTPRKNWLTSDFRLTIDGLEEACKYVSRIEPISLGWKATVDPVGTSREYSLELGDVTLGNLMVTLPESRAKGFFDWFNDFVIKGNNSSAFEKRGKLESGPFSLEFGNLGLAAMTGPTGAGVRQIKVEMYCESIKFSASAIT